MSESVFYPGEIWPDNNGVHINAHGGGFLNYAGKYYWYGEHKIAGTAGNQAYVGIHVYSSNDLYQWTDCGIAVDLGDNKISELPPGCVLERPKVIYCKRSGKFVMWCHFEENCRYRLVSICIQIYNKASVIHLNPEKLSTYIGLLFI